MPVQTPLPSKPLKSIDSETAQYRELNGNSGLYLSQIIAIGLHGRVALRGDRDGFVYFATDGVLVKIGYSLSPPVRLKGLRSPNRLPMRMIAYFPGSFAEEASVHIALASKLAHGDEWFTPCPEIDRLIAALKPHRTALAHGRITIADVLLGRHTSILEKIQMNVSIPTEMNEFSRWADRECPNWPAELQVRASHALSAMRRQYGSDPADIEKFEAAYRKWAGQ